MDMFKLAFVISDNHRFIRQIPIPLAIFAAIAGKVRPVVRTAATLPLFALPSPPTRNLNVWVVDM
jgi:hypothetical protein